MKSEWEKGGGSGERRREGRRKGRKEDGPRVPWKRNPASFPLTRTSCSTLRIYMPKWAKTRILTLPFTRIFFFRRNCPTNDLSSWEQVAPSDRFGKEGLDLSKGGQSDVKWERPTLRSSVELPRTTWKTNPAHLAPTYTASSQTRRWGLILWILSAIIV